MNKLIALTFFLGIIITHPSLCQIDTFQLEGAAIGNALKEWKFSDSLGNTQYYTNLSRRYILQNKVGEIIIDGEKTGGMGTNCGCEPKPNGIWIERYDNGSTKEIGEYECGIKIGLWTYFFDNGKIKKIEELQKPYLELFTQNHFDWDTLSSREVFRVGIYREYHKNGQLKIEGTYELVEVFSTSSYKIQVDPDTYEELRIPIKGEFWLPKSVKNGFWNEYDENGKILNHKEYKISYDFVTIRPIENRYIEIINK